MIHLRVYQRNSSVIRFVVSGHADYSEAGSDIVCSAVSALVINAINSAEKLLDIRLKVKDDYETLDCRVPHTFAEHAQLQLLLQSMVFGIEQTTHEYPKYAQVTYHRQ
ncbi:ribosomal-processing cysteine protease Prp [Alicyclobacillaceae bacterium I2511]|jgi:uncharacterized protein YsxB (DUF464 family)|nr:ribosomal-processing cysteine protease Prp [Alicyclobacillaceae bacterium I2511]